MKLTLEIDLAPPREAAARQIDAVFEARARNVSGCPTIHAVKARLARAVVPADAKARAAFDAVVAKADAADRAVLALDAQRLAAKRRLAAATTEQAIVALLTEIGA